MEIFPQKIEESFIHFYKEVKFDDKKIREEPREFILGLGEYIKNIFKGVNEVSETMAATLIYSCYKNMNSYLKKIFEKSISHFNMIGIYNLKLDLNYLKILADTEFSELSSMIIIN